MANLVIFDIGKASASMKYALSGTQTNLFIKTGEYV
jgi:hypothetical protein